jgi:peroxiredoxin
MEEFRKMGVEVLAASAQPVDRARETVNALRLSFPLGCAIDPKDFSRKTGAFYEAKDGYAQPTGFVLDLEGKIVNAVYSSRAIGRLVAKDCLGLIAHLAKT